MDKKLKTLFDFQRFDGNRDLQDVIDSVHAKYAKRELDLDELEMVNAAGDPDSMLANKKTEKKGL